MCSGYTHVTHVTIRVSFFKLEGDEQLLVKPQARRMPNIQLVFQVEHRECDHGVTRQRVILQSAKCQGLHCVSRAIGNNHWAMCHRKHFVFQKLKLP